MANKFGLSCDAVLLQEFVNCKTFSYFKIFMENRNMGNEVSNTVEYI